MVGFSILNVIIFLTILNLKSNPVSDFNSLSFLHGMYNWRTIRKYSSPFFIFDMLWKGITHAQLLQFCYFIFHWNNFCSIIISFFPNTNNWPNVIDNFFRIVVTNIRLTNSIICYKISQEYIPVDSYLIYPNWFSYFFIVLGAYTLVSFGCISFSVKVISFWGNASQLYF